MNVLSCLQKGMLPLLLGFAVIAAGGCATAAPVLVPFPERVSSEGATYAGILYLDEYVDDPGADDAELVWSVTSSAVLDVRLTTERHLIVKTEDTDWCGVEDLLLTVCNAFGECASQTVSFRVEAVPDDPVIDWIPAQVVGEAATFRSVDLRYFGSDPDGDTALTWSASRGTELDSAINDDVLAVSRRDPSWRGTEEIVLSLADSTGRTSLRTLTYTVTDGTPVTLTFIPNRPVLLESGGTRVLVDGLVRDAVMLSAREKQRIAAAEPPFEDIDLALATHEHYDHVTPSYVVEHLTASPGTVFASVAEIVPLLEPVPGYAAIADRVVAVPFVEGRSTDLVLAGVHVTAFPVRHQGDGSNLAWLVDVGGARILFLGDAGFEWTTNLRADYGWPDLDIDVAVLPARWLEVYEGTIVTEDIGPRFVLPGGALLTCPPLLDVPEGVVSPIVVCEQVETWIVPTAER